MTLSIQHLEPLASSAASFPMCGLDMSSRKEKQEGRLKAICSRLSHSIMMSTCLVTQKNLALLSLLLGLEIWTKQDLKKWTCPPKLKLKSKVCCFIYRPMALSALAGQFTI